MASPTRENVQAAEAALLNSILSRSMTPQVVAPGVNRVPASIPVPTPAPLLNAIQTEAPVQTGIPSVQPNSAGGFGEGLLDVLKQVAQAGLMGIAGTQNPNFIFNFMEHQAKQAERKAKKEELAVKKAQFQASFAPILAASKLPENVLTGIKSAPMEDQEKLFQSALKIHQDKSVLDSAESLIKTLPLEQRELARAAAKVGNTAFIGSLVNANATAGERALKRKGEKEEKVAKTLSQEQLIQAGQQAKLTQEQFNNFQALIKLGATSQAQRFLEKNAPGTIKALFRSEPVNSAEVGGVVVRHKLSNKTRTYPIGQVPKLTSDFEIVK